MSNLNIEKLVRVAIEILSKENFKGDLSYIRPSVDKTNIWKKMAERYFDNEDKKKDRMNIYSWWSRNTKNFKNLLDENYFKEDSEMGN